jgi:hypothetical protein
MERRCGCRGASSPPWSVDARAVATRTLFLEQRRGAGGELPRAEVRRCGPMTGSGGTDLGGGELPRGEAVRRR